VQKKKTSCNFLTARQHARMQYKASAI